MQEKFIQAGQERPVEKRKIKKAVKIYIGVIVMLAIFGFGVLIGSVMDDDFRNAYNVDEITVQDLPNIFDQELFEIVWSHLNTDFLKKDDLDSQKMFYSAIAGFVSGAGDPYTVYFDPETTSEFLTDISGEFQGIGAEVGIRDDVLTIVAPLPGSPAEIAGILSGDKVYEIDGISTWDISLEKAVKLIRGPKGTQVTLLVLRDDETTIDIVVTRDTIEIKSVEWEFRDDGLVYVELNSFHQDTSDLFKQLVKEIKKNKPKGIIVDLRNNPGGLLSEANYITALWVPNGENIVLERFSDGREVVYKSKGSSALKNYPTVLLINGGSASGSEILAGALKDLDLATLIGEKTFGKGSVQELKHLPDGSALKVTIAEWLTPLGNSINEVGIDPDIEVELTAEDYLEEKDPQLDKAIEVLLDK